MGLFDRFRRKASPAAPEAPTELPSLPFVATITSFHPGDGVGVLTIEGHAPIRFGRSACKGFEPAPGVSVEVLATATHPLGGWKATEVKLKSDAATYDALLVKRDAALGIEKSPRDPLKEAAATSQILGWIIVLLDEAPPTGPAALAEWAHGRGLNAAGIRVETQGTFSFGIGKHNALAYLGAGPFPDDRLAGFGVSDDFDPGRGFIGLSLGLPGNMPSIRAAGVPMDPWAPDGQLRDLSRIAFELSKHGPAVILPHAGTVLSAETFRVRLGNLDDSKSRPFAAWTGFAFNEEDALYSSYGMVLHGLPDVTINLKTSEPWELDRTREAILVACSQMVHTNRELAPGEQLSVSVGQPVGTMALSPLEGDAEKYIVEYRTVDAAGVLAAQIASGVTPAGSWVQLRRTSDARAKWATPALEPRVAFNTYRLLVQNALAEFLGAQTIHDLTPNFEGDFPAFQIDIWASRAEDGFFMSSNGIGRLPQKFAAATHNPEHVEFVAPMEAHHPMIASVIAEIASQVHQQKDASAVYKVGDTIGMPFPEIAAAGFVLGDAGAISIAEGPQLHLLELIPVSERELAEARAQSSRDLRERVGKMNPTARAQRWKLNLS